MPDSLLSDSKTVSGSGGGVRAMIGGFRKWGDQNEGLSKRNPFNRDYDGQFLYRL